MPSIALSSVEAVYEGQSAHASAMPHRGLNELDGVVLSYQAIAALRQHIRPSERIHGIITDGGQAPNIVPDRAAALYYIRAQNAGALATLKSRVKNCLEAGATASGTTVTLNWAQVDYLDLKTNMPLADAYDANIRRLGRDPIDASNLPSSFAGQYGYGQCEPSRALYPPHDCLCADQCGDSQSRIRQMGRVRQRRPGSA